MKTSPTLRNSVAAMLVAASLTIVPAAQAEDPDLSAVLARHAELLSELAKAVAAASQGAAPEAKKAEVSGLKTSSLQTSSLTTSSIQASSSLSTAGTGSLMVGLTPVEQWRVLFPEKK